MASSKIFNLAKEAEALIHSNPENALSLLTQAEEIEPNNAFFLKIKTKYLLAVGRFKEALGVAKKNAYLNGGVAAHGLYNKALLANGKNEKALKVARRVVSIFGGDAIAYGMLAQTLLVNGKNEEALIAAQKSVSLSESEIAYYLLSEVLIKNKRYAEALEIIRKIDAKKKVQKVSV